jgi:uncharacterized membrane protein YagU involved in acid resistance
MATPTKEQAEIYKIILDMVLKLIFSLVVIYVYLLIIYKFFSLKEWYQTFPLAGLEAFLTHTVYVAFKHYFPNRDNDPNT